MAEARTPDAIQREIESTRAELAGTIDAIADRVSPKKAASRGADAVKAQVSGLVSAVSGSSAPAVIDPDFPTTTKKALRADRVLLTVGAAAALVGGFVLLRSKK